MDEEYHPPVAAPRRRARGGRGRGARGRGRGGRGGGGRAAPILVQTVNEEGADEEQRTIKMDLLHPLQTSTGFEVGRFCIGRWESSNSELSNEILAFDIFKKDRRNITFFSYKNGNVDGSDFGTLECSNHNFQELASILPVCLPLRIGISCVYSVDEDDMMNIHVLLKQNFVSENFVEADMIIRKILAFNSEAPSKFGVNVINWLMVLCHPDRKDSFPPIKYVDVQADLRREEFEDVFDVLRTKRTPVVQQEISKSSLISTLKPYQEEAVQWMIQRESDAKLELNSLLSSCQIGQLYYFPSFGVFCRSPDIPDTVVRGGILADQMGLGKTLEMLTLICTSKSPIAPQRKMREIENAKNDDSEIVVKASRVSFEMALQNVHYDIDESGEECPEDQKIRCKGCSVTCSKQKMHWNTKMESESTPFYCPDCMHEKDLVEAPGTLIIIPEILLLQWYEEIRKHVAEELVIDIYRGVEAESYKHPHYLKQCDIVLCSYEVLRKELDYAEQQGVLIGKKRYYVDRMRTVTTPLVRVSWWRMCIDESQLVEKASSKAAVMCSKLTARSRWCITGTPIMQSVADFRGLLTFLDYRPFCVERIFNTHLLNYWRGGEKDRLTEVLGPIFWRNSKFDVRDQLNIPGIEHITTELHFTPIEERFYREKLWSCNYQLVSHLEARSYNDEKRLCDLPDRMQKSLMELLNSVRLSILTGDSHLEAADKKKQNTYTSESLYSRLLERVCRRIEEQTGQYLQALTVYGHVVRLYKPWQAVEIFVKALGVQDELLNIVKQGGEDAKGLFDTKLRPEQVYYICSELKELQKKDIKLPDELATNLDLHIEESTKKYIVGQYRSAQDAWAKWAEHTSTLEMDSIKKAIQQLKSDKGFPKFFSTLKTDVQTEAWIEEQEISDHDTFCKLFEAKFDILCKDLFELRDCCMNDLPFPKEGESECDYLNSEPFMNLVHCPHTSAKATRRNTKKAQSTPAALTGCALCIVQQRDENLRQIVIKQASKITGDILSPEQLKHICEMIHDSCGSKKILLDWLNEFELLMKLLRRISTTMMMLVLNVRDLRLSGAHFEKGASFVCAGTPINLAVDYSFETEDAIQFLKRHAESNRTSLFDYLAQFPYIKSLQDRSDGFECPVCFEKITMRWRVFPCAHSVCVPCFETLTNMPNQPLKCVVCRAGCAKPDVSLVQKERGIGAMTVKFSAIAEKLKAVLEQSENDKILLFTSLANAVKPLCEVLEKEQISFLHMKSQHSHSTLETFRNTAKSRVLVMYLGHCANGLNLTQANHIFFVEPTTEKSVVSQAIGRIERLGQMQKMSVHHFVMHGSIEEEIHRLVHDTTSEEGWTVGTLRAIFQT